MMGCEQRIVVDGVELTVEQAGNSVTIKKVVARDRERKLDVTSGVTFAIDRVDDPWAIALVRKLKRVAEQPTARCTTVEDSMKMTNRETMSDDDVLRDRVDGLRAWALSRVHWCDNEIDRCGPAGAGDAVIERRSLRAVLRILDGRPAEPPTHAKHRGTRYGHDVLIGCACGWRGDPEAKDPDAEFKNHTELARSQEGD